MIVQGEKNIDFSLVETTKSNIEPTHTNSTRNITHLSNLLSQKLHSTCVSLLHIGYVVL